MRGKLECLWCSCRASFPFNEARALCAGSYRVLDLGAQLRRPSMRPAHYAREVGPALAAEWG